MLSTLVKWIILVVSCSMAAMAFAADITTISEKRRLVNINKGKIDGFTPNEDVCFYEVSGKLVGCGRVKRAKLYSASIQVSGQLIKQVNKTQSARVKKIAAARGLIPPVFAFRALLNPTFLSPIKFNSLFYLAPDTNSTATLWEPGTTIKSTPLSFALEGDLMRYRLTLGLRGRVFRIATNKSDYDVRQDQYMEMQFRGSAVGSYLDVAVFKTASKTERQFTLALGLDYDISTIDTNGLLKVYDSKEELKLYRIKSTLTTLSARLVSKLDWILESSILGIGLNILFPLSSSQQLSVQSKDTENRTKIENPDLNIKENLNHTTNDLGIETTLSYAIPF